MKEKFKSPPMSCRAFPFWAWNARLEEDEIVRQIHEMRDRGFGGFFIHSREGLETEYMSEEWLRLVRAAVREAKELGMYVWLYDEDRWPSGTAGGMVTAGDSPYRLKGLTLEVNGKADGDTIAMYAAKISGDDMLEMRRITESRVNAGETLLVMRREFSKGSEWFNGSAPPDNLDPETVTRFLELTHEKYLDAVGDEFGETIPGIFSDEPGLADIHAAFEPRRSWIPWTDGFDAYFEEVNGYDFWGCAPLIWFNCAKSRKIRHDYWKAVTLRFVGSFTKQIQGWCHAHGISSTGHFLWEDRPGTAARTGGAIMPHYEYQDMPGIDILRYNTDEFLTVRQCVSAAHQLGKPNTIAEVYGAAGWELTLEDMRRIGDWLYVLGINRRAQHTCLYSLTGCRKRDYPPSFAYNNPAFENISAVEDYFARLGAVLEEGECPSDILVIHPSTTVWSLLGASPYGNPVRKNERDFPLTNGIGAELNALIRELCFARLNAELGDELIMQRHAFVDGDRLVVGGVSYKTVVLPRLGNLLSTTAALLRELIANGGEVIAVETLPETEDGMPAQPLRGVKIVKDNTELISRLSENDNSEIRISGSRRLLLMHRKTACGDFAFVVNRSDSSADVCAECRRITQAEEWEALTGEIYALEAEQTGGGTRVRMTLEPYGSALIRFGESDAKTRAGKKAAFPETKPIGEGIMVLSRCRYRIGDEPYSREMEVWEAQKEIRERLGMRPVHKNGGVQRYMWINEAHERDGTLTVLRFEFVNTDISGGLCLAAEHPENFEILFNKKKVENKTVGYLYDRGIKKLRIGKAEPGTNEICLRCSYMNRYELENIYLTHETCD